jgi:hypothetical protein
MRVVWSNWVENSPNQLKCLSKTLTEASIVAGSTASCADDLKDLSSSLFRVERPTLKVDGFLAMDWTTVKLRSPHCPPAPHGLLNIYSII